MLELFLGFIGGMIAAYALRTWDRREGAKFTPSEMTLANSIALVAGDLDRLRETVNDR